MFDRFVIGRFRVYRAFLELTGFAGFRPVGFTLGLLGFGVQRLGFTGFMAAEATV